MKKNIQHTINHIISEALKLLLIFILFVAENSNAQVLIPFTQRTSQYSPTKEIYHIKGDFQMIGNSNLTLQNYSQTTNNSNNSMVYVDVDNDPSTINSSSAVLNIPVENGSIPSCSNIIYAGLYWTGRAHDEPSPNTFDVEQTTYTLQPINNNQTVANNEIITYTNYKLAISRSGGNNNRTITYTFAPSSGNPGNTIVFTYAHNNGNPTLTVSINNGSPTTVSTSSITDSNAYLSNPYEIYSETGGITLSVDRFYRNGSNSDVNFATAYTNVSGTGLSPQITIKSLDKSTVLIKHANASSYTTISANDASFTQNIYFPTTTDGYMYSAYAEITDYVQEHGIGEYFVADIALREGNGGSTGYYGGWGLVVVYENSKMNWRDITIFDGHAYVASGAGYGEVPVSGFNTVQSGNVNMKIGLMAGEGDYGISGDYFEIQDHTSSNWIPLSHGGNSITNFFNSSIFTGGNDRNPNLTNNTGLDIAMFNISNPNNSVLTNNQKSTKFRYYSNQDAYVIFNITIAVDAYIPELDAINKAISVNGTAINSSMEVFPNDIIEYTVEIRNKGTEAINNAYLSIPIPYTTIYDSSTAIYYEGLTGNQPTFDPNVGASGIIYWEIGNLPLATDINTLLAQITYRIKVTDEETILSDINFEPTISITGNTGGTGEISGFEFTDIPIIHEDIADGNCNFESLSLLNSTCKCN